LRSFSTTGTFDVYLVNSSGALATANGLTGGNTFGTTFPTAILLADDASPKSINLVNGTAFDDEVTMIWDMDATDNIGYIVVPSSAIAIDTTEAFTVDIFSFGFTNDGFKSSERVQDQIVRIEAEESGDNTSIFEGTLEFVLVNQVNILANATYTSLTPIADDPTFVVIEDLTDEDAPRVTYLDLGADGVATQISDQQAAPTHSGVVSLDSESYKIADTVTVTLEDNDLNVNSDLVDIYTVVTKDGDPNESAVGSASVSSSLGNSITFSNGDQLGRLLDITFNDERWTDNSCTDDTAVDESLNEAGFTLVETSSDSGIFVGDFQIPSTYCPSGVTAAVSTTGVDIEVNYVDFRDASGEIIEVGDGAAVRANTGSITLDRTVYPVPFSGSINDFTTASNTSSQPNGRALFPTSCRSII
jgi:hypothetical protein